MEKQKTEKIKEYIFGFKNFLENSQEVEKDKYTQGAIKTLEIVLTEIKRIEEAN